MRPLPLHMVLAILLTAGPAFAIQGRDITAPPRASSPTEAPTAGTDSSLVTVRRGDTLVALLASAGAGAAEAHAASIEIAKHVAPNSLRPGDEIAFRFTDADPPALIEVALEPEPGRTIRAWRGDAGIWRAEESMAPRSRYLVQAQGVVDGGLFPAMTEAGLPAGLAISLVRALSHQIDFQRDLQPGDRFEVLFERFRSQEGDVLGHGQILRAEITLSGRRLAFWRYTNRRGVTDWYDAEGRSLRRAFLRTPLDGARVSSRFGLRRHPILGYTRMHRGIDFAAPTGTPVYAAADGVVVSAKRHRGYGLMVRLRHAGGYETRYAHLSRFARGIRPGQRVRQGSVIGAVGSTGMSTGPHLHYEILARGRHVNPGAHVRHTVRLAGGDLSGFRAHQRSLARSAARLGAREEIALAAD